jgi:hypothetical protein
MIAGETYVAKLMLVREKRRSSDLIFSFHCLYPQFGIRSVEYLYPLPGKDRYTFTTRNALLFGTTKDPTKKPLLSQFFMPQGAIAQHAA